VAFVVERSGAAVSGYRVDLGGRALSALASPSFRPHATLDLHGHRTRGLEEHLSRALRDLLHDGPTRVLLIHGKGLHSPSRTGVLRDAVLALLTEGPCAPLVRAFRTAPTRLGGEGALIVEIGRG
jgi:DNA-nicking Smr family endonuclease